MTLKLTIPHVILYISYYIDIIKISKYPCPASSVESSPTTPHFYVNSEILFGSTVRTHHGRVANPARVGTLLAALRILWTVFRTLVGSVPDLSAAF